MAQLLEKLFTWQYFEPVLFTSIGVLLLLLFIVLFLGKKDQKRKLEDTKKLEVTSLTEENSVDAFAKEETPAVAAEIPAEPAPVAEPDPVPVVVADEAPIPPVVADAPVVAEEPVVSEPEVTFEKPEETSVEDNIMPDFEIFNQVSDDTPDDVVVPEVANIDAPQVTMPTYEEQPVVDPVPVVEDVVKSSVVPEEEAKEAENAVELTDEKINDFKNNFADLASSISKELDEINKMQEESKDIPVVNETPVVEETPVSNVDLPLPNEIDVTPIKEATKFTPTEVFSSVYTPNTKPAENIELPKQEDSNPFKDEMPAPKEEKAEMELPKINKEPVNVPDFSAFDNESFDIK